MCFLQSFRFGCKNDESCCRNFLPNELKMSICKHAHSFLVKTILENTTTSAINKSKTKVGVNANVTIYLLKLDITFQKRRKSKINHLFTIQREDIGPAQQFPSLCKHGPGRECLQHLVKKFFIIISLPFQKTS